MALTTGFQINTTIHAAWWIYKPDPLVDSVSQEEFFETNGLQRIEANAEILLLGNISTIQVDSNIVLVTGTFEPGIAPLRSGQLVIFRGLTNADFLNGQIACVMQATPSGFNAKFTHADYGPAAEPGGQTVDTTGRTAYLTYPEMGISTAQGPRKLSGAVAARFIYDMETLFGIS